MVEEFPQSFFNNYALMSRCTTLFPAESSTLLQLFKVLVQVRVNFFIYRLEIPLTIEIAVYSRPEPTFKPYQKTEKTNSWHGIINQETAGLIVRSRIKWAEHGEKSSRYFCNLEKRSSEKKVIRSLNVDNGIPQTDPSEILKELHAFYDSLYSSPYTETSDQAACSFLDQIDIPPLSEQSKETLNQPVTKSELLQNLNSMSHNKSPGLDGLPVEFYIAFFHDIADLLIASLNFFL